MFYLCIYQLTPNVSEMEHMHRTRLPEGKALEFYSIDGSVRMTTET
jgi:hypothetical protein